VLPPTFNTGAQLWSYATGDLVESSPAVAKGVVYVGSGAQFFSVGNMYALDASTGTLLWSYATYRVNSSPAVVNGMVYVGSAHDIYAFGLK